MTSLQTEAIQAPNPSISYVRTVNRRKPIFKNVAVEKTRHGKRVVYYRKNNGTRIRLPDVVGSPEFLIAYAAVLSGDLVASPLRPTRTLRDEVNPVANKMFGTLRGARTRARMNGYEYVLSEQWCLEQLFRQGGRCALTGMRFSVAGTGMRGRDPYCPSLDRIDNSKGYTPENTRIVILAINIMLADWGEDVFQTVIRRYSAQRKLRPPDQKE